MKHMKFLTFFFCIAFAVFACSSSNETDSSVGGLPDKEESLTTDFAKGADISWVTEMEHKGIQYLRCGDRLFSADEAFGPECGSTQSMVQSQRT